jgi:predicted outer membrane repeat protein
VSACVFSNNQTTGGWGGAIFNDGNLTLSTRRFRAISRREDTETEVNITVFTRADPGVRVPPWEAPSTPHLAPLRWQTARSRAIVQEAAARTRAAAACLAQGAKAVDQTGEPAE